MKAQYELFYLWLADELPSIGSGIRLVEARIGYKWVWVRSPYPYAQRTYRSKLKLSAWEALKPLSHALFHKWTKRNGIALSHALQHPQNIQSPSPIKQPKRRKRRA